MSESVRKVDVSVFGAGSWGTALAIQLARLGRETLLWGRDSDKLASMQANRSNPYFLKDIPFPDQLTLEADLAVAVSSSPVLLAAVPTSGIRAFCQNIRDHLQPNTSLIWACKGIEQPAGKLVHEIIAEELGDKVIQAVVSGPTFAMEVAKDYPTAMTLAAETQAAVDTLQTLFHGGNMRVYSSTDILGVELGGAIKNVLAIAVGVSDGLGFGANARSALITRGLAEIMRLGEALGAQRETLMGLSGLGDLILTATDDQSRNRRFGLLLGAGKTQEQALEEIQQVVEGAKTAGVIVDVAKRAGVDMPICTAVYRLLYEGITPASAVKELLARSSRAEF